MEANNAKFDEFAKEVIRGTFQGKVREIIISCSGVRPLQRRSIQHAGPAKENELEEHQSCLLQGQKLKTQNVQMILLIQ